jgi:hypothetical protein
MALSPDGELEELLKLADKCLPFGLYCWNTSEHGIQVRLQFVSLLSTFCWRQ